MKLLIQMNRNFINLCLFSVSLIVPLVFSAEKDINIAWCDSIGGEVEFRTKDGTYVDCLTDEYAIEVEYDYKWKEAIGQSLHYAESTNKKAGILFIKRKESKKNYFNEMLRVIENYQLPIKIFVIEEES